MLYLWINYIIVLFPLHKKCRIQVICHAFICDVTNLTKFGNVVFVIYIYIRSHDHDYQFNFYHSRLIYCILRCFISSYTYFILLIYMFSYKYFDLTSVFFIKIISCHFVCFCFQTRHVSI